MTYEYGIKHVSDTEAHRWNMTEEEARNWIDDWIKDGGRGEAFVIIRREVGDWEEVEPQEEKETITIKLSTYKKQTQHLRDLANERMRWQRMTGMKDPV